MPPTTPYSPESDPDDRLTAREALVASILGELGSLLTRVEALPVRLDKQVGNVVAASDQLTAAGDRLRAAVDTYTEQAKREVTQHLERRADLVIRETQQSQRTAIAELVRESVRTAISSEAESLSNRLRSAAAEYRRASWMRLAENAALAMFSAVLTAVLVYGAMR